MQYLLYIHGFLSSPQSLKARVTASWMAEHHPDITFLCPELSSYPQQASAALNELTAELPAEQIGVIGSSLGGFWATWLLERQRVKRAVLINPAVTPQNLVGELLDKPLKNYYSSAEYRLDSSHVAALKTCDYANLRRPEAYWLMVQKGDETLPYEQSVAKYHASRQTIEEGGSHTFDGYENWLPEILNFLQTP
ncbi:YqiA/YcfP family alpha/beta fold hydrolase [Teredinibacter turnerae]|uniref:YqiA/YcfP family alpha/beta fold hydrolase n=2 Tax=Teredinibacter turnerae TaxID=2426 RepID=UPI000413AB17|nr:YqiA/YcfP family alpha/beta fold hydrolase [Teredinibacter turnerae]